MITAKELHDKASEIGNTYIPESVIDSMVDAAKKGLYSITLLADSDFGVQCRVNSDAPQQHAELDKIKKCLESHGYRVVFLYPYSDNRFPIDGVIVSW